MEDDFIVSGSSTVSNTVARHIKDNSGNLRSDRRHGEQTKEHGLGLVCTKSALAKPTHDDL